MAFSKVWKNILRPVSAVRCLTTGLQATGMSTQSPVTVTLQNPSDIHQQRALRIFRRIVKERTGLEVVATNNAPLVLGFRTDIGAEGFSLEDGPGKTIKVLGHGLPGLMAGLGKFLRIARGSTNRLAPGDAKAAPPQAS